MNQRPVKGTSQRADATALVMNWTSAWTNLQIRSAPSWQAGYLDTAGSNQKSEKTMRPIFLLVVLACIAIAAPTSIAQNATGHVIGRITERVTGQPIAGAHVQAGTGPPTVSSADGSFTLELESGVYDVRVEATGFVTVIRNQISVTGGRSTPMDVALDQAITEKVEVRSDIFSSSTDQPVSGVVLSREDIRSVPGTAGDPLRALNSQPAVSAASGEFADLIVRGGSAEENLTFVDNIPVPDFTYFTDKYDGSRGGRAAILPPDVFERAEFSAGGFGARYGDRMSSALDVTIREANRRRVQGVLFADSGTAGGSVDVPLGERGGWLFSGRRSYIDVALDLAGIADRGLIGYPKTLDFTNKVIYDLTPRNRLSFTAMNFFETFDQTDEQGSPIARRTDRLRMRRTSERHVFGSTLTSTFGTTTLSRTTAWGSVAHNDGIFALPFSPIVQRSRDLRDSTFGIKEDVTSTLSRTIDIAVGGGAYVDQANYHSFENSHTFFSPLEEEFNASPRENRLVLGSTVSSFGYVQSTWRATPTLAITPGLRIDHYGVTGETLVSPRLSARLGLRSNVALTFATGTYRQPPSLFVLSLTPANRGLQSQTSTHVIGGIEWLAREDIRVRVEAYRKSYRRLVVQPIFPTEGFSVSGNYFNSGSGTSTGAEVSIQKALTGFFSGQASYAFVHARRRFFESGNDFASDFERPHQLTLIGITRFHGYSVAAKYRLASGLPYTLRTAVPAFGSSSLFLHRIASASDINASRLPNFASLDLRGEKRFGFGRWSLAPYIDIFNITNHDSVVQPNYEFFDPRPQFLRENERLPIFGFRIEF